MFAWHTLDRDFDQNEQMLACVPHCVLRAFDFSRAGPLLVPLCEKGYLSSPAAFASRVLGKMDSKVEASRVGLSNLSRGEIA